MNSSEIKVDENANNKLKYHKKLKNNVKSLLDNNFRGDLSKVFNNELHKNYSPNKITKNSPIKPNKSIRQI